LPNAARRLRAIEEFSELGAGFALAMRDLEIRGAGNILGTQQSGHIAMVGYELYCELLEQAVARLKQLPPKEAIDVDIDLPGEAFLPRSYVPDMRLKIDLYRRLARAATEADLAALRSEMLDRFGPPPEPVERLLALGRLRLAAHHWAIDSIRTEGRYLVLSYMAEERIRQLARRAGDGRLRVVDDRTAYLPLDDEFTLSDGLLSRLESLLRPE
jgi:transcription-repair coupling factor (superfamily II helicase)